MTKALALAGTLVLLIAGTSMPINKITIVALGDSTTAGTPYTDLTVPYTYWVGRRHPEWTVINRGINGERSDAIRARFATQVLPVHPRYVIILAGVNDTYAGIPVEQTEENLRAMYRDAELHGIIPIAATILPFDEAAPLDQEKIRTINAWIRMEVETSRLAFVDLNQVARDPRNPDKLRGTAEGLHPDKVTYQLMGEAVADRLEQLEKEFSTPVRQR